MMLKDGIRTILLAGVGAIAITGEKSMQVIEDLVKKGELTVEEGKALNEDLAKKWNESDDKIGLTRDTITKSFRDLVVNVDRMSQEERDELMEKLQSANAAAKEEGQEVADEMMDAAISDETPEQEEMDVISEAFDSVAKDAARTEPASEVKQEAQEVVAEITEAVTADETSESEEPDVISEAFDAVTKE